jgi:hypothetical protein
MGSPGSKREPRPVPRTSRTLTRPPLTASLLLRSVLLQSVVSVAHQFSSDTSFLPRTNRSHRAVAVCRPGLRPGGAERPTRSPRERSTNHVLQAGPSLCDDAVGGAACPARCPICRHHRHHSAEPVRPPPPSANSRTRLFLTCLSLLSTVVGQASAEGGFSIFFRNFVRERLRRRGLCCRPSPRPPRKPIRIGPRLPSKRTRPNHPPSHPTCEPHSGCRALVLRTPSLVPWRSAPSPVCHDAQCTVEPATSKPSHCAATKRRASRQLGPWAAVRMWYPNLPTHNMSPHKADCKWDFGDSFGISS